METTGHPTIVIWESGRDWYRRLRKRLPTATLVAVTLRESLEERLRERPGSSVLIDVPRRHLVDRLEAICQLQHRDWRVIAAVLPRELGQERHWFFRAGATWVQMSPRVAPALIDLLKRQRAPAPPTPSVSWRDRLWEQLPWKQFSLEEERQQP